MFFEGSEKKLEMIIEPSRPSLRSWGDEVWAEVVAQAQAQILSKISSDHCDAYLLSESSLFVWDDRLTMITCGQTTLVQAALDVYKRLDRSGVRTLIYERKNEYLPQLQHSDFFKDIEVLRSVVPGKAFRFGDADEHHLYLFHMDNQYTPGAKDTTLEVLMYDLQGVANQVFNCSGMTTDEIRSRTKVDQILPGFEVDDFVFDPCGYSLNALKGNTYFTIHVTPQEVSPYVSFETNIKMEESYLPLIRRVLEVFQPTCFDTVIFCPNSLAPFEMKGFQQKTVVQEDLACGYNVNFSHFFQPIMKCRRAFEFK
jgi:S-adenosylmethionine decarboxylase